MANNDMIQAKQVVDDLTASFEKHATQVKNAWDNLKDYSKGIAELPSEVKAMMTAINNDTQAVLKQNEVLKQSIILAKQKQAEAVKLATIEKQAEQVAQQKLRTSIQENNLKKSNISLSTAETNAENRATKQKEALLAKNEHLSRSYVKLKNELTQASNKLQDYTVSLGRGNAKTVQAQKEFDILSKKVGQADKAIGKLSSSNSAINALSGSVGNLMGAFGIGTGIFLAVDIAKGIYETTKEVQSLDTALKIVTKTEENFYDKQVMLNKLANDYGADINQLSKMFTQFYVSAKDKVSETEINRIFQGITKNANALGLTIQQQERGFLALNQMFSKTTVQSEELTGQLSEALPGAFKNMVQAYKNLHPEMKVTERSFREMMKDGKIMSSEILPEFIRVTDRAFGTENVK
jgi:tape measure domain-containing protein